MRRYLERDRAAYPEAVEGRPLTRGACADVPRPCPYVSCRHHNFLEVNRNGSLVLNFPDLEPDEIPHACSLDAADGGPMFLEEVAVAMNLTRQRVRQIEQRAAARVRKPLERLR